MLNAQGMQGWRRFTFLDPDPSMAVPPELAGQPLERSSCGTAHANWVALGQRDGTVTLLDTVSQATASFQAHTQAVTLMAPLPVSRFILCCYYETQKPVCKTKAGSEGAHAARQGT